MQMLSGSYRLKRLHANESLAIDHIALLLRNTYHTQVSSFFIYHDPNYAKYLRMASLDEDNFWIYQLIDSLGKQMVAFAILTRKERDVFLNQIVVLEHFRGYNLAAKLLSDILGLLLKKYGNDEFSSLKLETFHSNQRAMAIYQHWKMEDSPGKNWYLNMLQDKDNQLHKPIITCSTITDRYGFLQLYANNNPMGTVINGDRARTNGAHIDDVQILIKYLNMQMGIYKICLVTEQQLQLPLIDRTITYSLGISELRDMLSTTKL